VLSLFVFALLLLVTAYADARRRYYRLTRLGRSVLDLECERLQAMVRMMQRKRKQEAY